jgi:hypothetical protein
VSTVKDVAEQIKFLLDHGRSEEKAVLLLPRLENRRKQKNPQKRFVWMCDDTHAARLYAVKDRYMEALGNKTVTLEVVLGILEHVDDARLRAIAEAGHQSR